MKVDLDRRITQFAWISDCEADDVPAEVNEAADKAMN